MLTREIKKRMIEKVVYDKFNQQIKTEVARLIKDSIKFSIESYELTKFFGVRTSVAKEPLMFHIGEISKELVTNLEIIFDDENGNIQAEKNT